MADMQEDVKPKSKVSTKPKAKAKPEVESKLAQPAPDSLGVDWMKIGAEVEKAIQNKGYNKAAYSKNPAFLQGILMRLVASEVITKLK